MLETPPSWPLRRALAIVALLAAWALVLVFQLTPALFAGVLVFAGARGLAALLRRRGLGSGHAEAWGVALLVLLLGLTLFLVGDRIVDAANGPLAFSALMARLASILEQLREVLPGWASSHLPEGVEPLREAMVTWMRSHAGEMQLWGGHTLRGLGHALLGAVIGALAAVQLARPTSAAEAADAAAPVSPIDRPFETGVRTFVQVVSAQLRISAINTVLTAVFLLGILPLTGHPLPMAGTLVGVTFVAGLVPVLGNLVSNTVTVIVALGQSLGLAAAALAWLVFIHKVEYFLNAHIIGTRIRAQAWELLIAMLVCEAIFGLGGVISAPIIYAQLKALWTAVRPAGELR